MTLIDQVKAQKQKLARAESKVATERATLRELMDAALRERYRKADLARAMSVSRQRVGELLRSK